MVSIVYVKCNPMLRKSLWASLSNLTPLSMSWITIDNFNIIKSDEEKIRGPPLHSFAKADFVDFIKNNSLYDLPFLGSKFTWSCCRDGIYT